MSLSCISLDGLSVFIPGNTIHGGVSWVHTRISGRVHGLAITQLPASHLATPPRPQLPHLSPIDHALLSFLSPNTSRLQSWLTL